MFWSYQRLRFPSRGHLSPRTAASPQDDQLVPNDLLYEKGDYRVRGLTSKYDHRGGA